MKMNLKIDIKDFKKFLSWVKMRQILVDFFYRRAQLFAFLILVLVTLYLVFIWYGNIFHSQWSEAQVQEYIQTKQSKSDTVFNRKNFEKVVDETNIRRAEFEKSLDNLEDIFRLNE